MSLINPQEQTRTLKQEICVFKTLEEIDEECTLCEGTRTHADEVKCRYYIPYIPSKETGGKDAR